MSMSPSRRSRVTVAALLAAPVLVIGASQVSYAQSTGTVEAENLAEVIVTGRRVRSLAGVTDQTAAKSRITVTGETLQNYASGQTFLDSLNQVPGLNFTNNDAYGSSGGNLRLRGFDGARVSLTFDGIPLNDTGNYAVYTNQQIDPELIEAVDVNLGTTDVDSPTASAVGGTINNRTRRPGKDMGGMASLSVGEDNFRRVFGMFDTGELGPFGTRAYIAGSYARNDKFKGPGEIFKRQFNARIQQDLDNGNFVAASFHFNRNRNNFYRNANEATFLANGRQFDNLATCTRLMGTAGVADNEGSSPNTGGTENPLNPSACTNYYNLRINPSDTGNIRINSLWHLSDKLRLSVDPSFQYTLANGGGTSTIAESVTATTVDKRVVGNSGRLGFDLNGDGDTLDTVRFYSPNNTNTKRYGVNASLIWDLSETQRVRFAYTLDYGKHRQTAAWGYLDANGNPENVFGGRQGRKVATADGSYLRGRDRYSIAELNQVSAEYRGKFLDERLTATIGVRAPYFTRELNQYCHTVNGSGNVLCTTQTPAATRANGNVVFVDTPTATEYIPPFAATAKFDEILPNVSLNYAFTDNQTVYASYAAGLSSPRVDNLYGVRRLADGSLARVNPDPEQTDSIDLGWRYNADNVIAVVAVWQSKFKNRIVSAFDPDLGFSVDRNVGDVDLKGVDMQIGWRANDWMTVSANASYNDSELKNDLRVTSTSTLPTKGKAFVETPEYTYGGRIDLRPIPNLTVGLEGKFVDERFTTDVNDAKVPSYTLFHLNAAYDFEVARLKGLRAQFVIYNLLDEEFFGSLGSSTNAITTNGVSGFSPTLALGAPRSMSLSVIARF
ncbi:MAG: TonB-dependent receptor [Gammaproteobacteria bacterium]|jgi:iron complex outermembrane receptor protein